MRRPGARGAAALLVLSAVGMLMTGGVAAIDGTAYLAADERAQTAADAAAHAAEAAVMSDSQADSLSIAAQAGEVTCETMDDSRCSAFVVAASSAAEANGGRLLAFRLGPDLRDVRAGSGAGRLTTLVEVAVPRRLRLPVSACHGPSSDDPTLCWATSWSAAQQVAAPPNR